jgi:hypothetical protein
MTARLEIRCINKSDHSNPHERIINVGGLTAEGTHWKLSQTEAIHSIVKDTCLFYVKRGGNEVNVVIASQSGWKYLKTTADGDQPDNLLSLPECPS